MVCRQRAWGSGLCHASLPVPLTLAGPAVMLLSRKEAQRVFPLASAFRALGQCPSAYSLDSDTVFEFSCPAIGSGPPDIGPSNILKQATIVFHLLGVRPLGPVRGYYCHWGQSVVSVHVRVVVVEASAPIVGLGFSSAIVLGSFAVYLRQALGSSRFNL